MNTLAGAFRNRRTRPSLPTSLKGLWKADLFFGFQDLDKWVATTVKVNPAQIQGAEGLRIGIVPNRAGKSDKVRFDEDKNLVICPINHDYDFMETFYKAWRLLQGFIDADAKVPKENVIPETSHREVCRILEERREFSVLEAIEAIEIFSQKGLLKTEESDTTAQGLKGAGGTELLVAPEALSSDVSG